jgi:hypothetical protein
MSHVVVQSEGRSQEIVEQYLKKNKIEAAGEPSRLYGIAQLAVQLSTQVFSALDDNMQFRIFFCSWQERWQPQWTPRFSWNWPTTSL